MKLQELVVKQTTLGKMTNEQRHLDTSTKTRPPFVRADRWGEWRNSLGNCNQQLRTVEEPVGHLSDPVLITYRYPASFRKAHSVQYTTSGATSSYGSNGHMNFRPPKKTLSWQGLVPRYQ